MAPQCGASSAPLGFDMACLGQNPCAGHGRRRTRYTHTVHFEFVAVRGFVFLRTPTRPCSIRVAIIGSAMRGFQQVAAGFLLLTDLESSDASHKENDTLFRLFLCSSPSSKSSMLGGACGVNRLSRCLPGSSSEFVHPAGAYGGWALGKSSALCSSSCSSLHRCSTKWGFVSDT